MKIKKILATVLISMLSVCMAFVFGFQIDVTGTTGNSGGSAQVTLDPLKAAADAADAAVKEAELALEETLFDLEESQAAFDEAEADLLASLTAVEEAELALAGLEVGGEGYDEAVLVLDQAEADLAAAQLVYDEAETDLEAALLAVQQAEAALEAAVLAAEEANEAYYGSTGTTYSVDEETLAELQQAVEDAQQALDEAIAGGTYTEDEIEELEEQLEEATEELEEAVESRQEGDNREGKAEYFHIVTNSNNGGSFSMEGIYFGSSGEILSYDFTADEGYELAWLRVGNTKIYPDELNSLYELSFDRKNLVMHAHFKKVKDTEPEDEAITTTEEGTPDEGLVPDDEEDGKNNGKGKGQDKDRAKGKGKEKSNNGRKNRNK